MLFRSTEDKARDKLRHAIENHRLTNAHHPEAWGGIDKMPDVCLAEMVCDWKGRSEERGTSLHDWIGTAKVRFKIPEPAMARIMDFVNLLCAKPFVAP